MEKNNKKQSIQKVLLYIASLISILMCFSFVLPATVLIGKESTYSYGAKMISWMLGTNGTIKTAGMSILFILEIIIVLLGVLFLVVSYFKPLSKKITNIYMISLASMLLICVILSFLTRTITCNVINNSVKDKMTPTEYEDFIKKMNATHNSYGPIIYSCSGLISLILVSISIFLSNYKFDKEIKK